MKTKYLIEITLALLFLAGNASFSNVCAQGSLTPPGAPGPTMLSLSQVQPRIPITSVPFTIINPGSYYLTGNLGNQTYYILSGHILELENTLAGTNAITILANNVTVDLSGYTLTGIAGSASATNGIYIGAITNVTICNGSIADFGNGVNAPGGVVNARVTGLTVSDCVYDGIFLGFYSSPLLVESCMVNNMGSYGIIAGQVCNSTAQNCVNTAIYANNTAENCTGISSGSVGLECLGTAMNCEGISTDDNGLSSYEANNCYGYSSGTAVYGLYAGYTAMNCTGIDYASNGWGLYGYLAIGCYGYGTTQGIDAAIANSCYSSSGDTYITYHYNMP
jgi:hypothetical protein